MNGRKCALESRRRPDGEAIIASQPSLSMITAFPMSFATQSFEMNGCTVDAEIVGADGRWPQAAIILAVPVGGLVVLGRKVNGYHVLKTGSHGVLWTYNPKTVYMASHRGSEDSILAARTSPPRPACVAFLATAVSLHVPAHADTVRGPMDIVQQLYRGDPAAAKLAQYESDKLKHLFDLASQSSGRLGRPVAGLYGSPVCDCQVSSIDRNSVRFTVISVAADKETINVWFHDQKGGHLIGFDLVRAARGWAIDDIRGVTPKPWSYAAMLSEGAKEQ